MLDIINIDFIKNYNEMPSNNGSNHSREISGRSNFHEMFKNSIRESENKNKNEYSHEIKSNNKAKKNCQAQKTDKDNRKDETSEIKKNDTHKSDMKTKTDESKEVKSGSKNKIKSKPDSKENTEEKKLLIETLPEELLENILKLIDKIKDSPENNDKRDIKGLKEIAGSLKNLKEALLKMQGDQKGIKENSLIKENLDKLQLLLEKFDTKKSGKKIDIKKLFTQVKKSLEKLETLNENILSSLKTGKKINIPGRLKNRGRRKVTGAESHNNQKVESEEIIKNTIIETSSHENNKSNDGNKQSLFNFNNMKNIKIDSGNNTPSGKQANNSIFRQQLNSILENAKVVVKDGKNGSFSVKLYPKKLGNINVNLGLDRGVIHGKFIVESQEAKELLTQNLSFITQQLKEAGISVGSFEVNVSDRNNMFYNDEENAAGAMDPDEQEILINEYDMNSMAELSTGINLII